MLGNALDNFVENALLDIEPGARAAALSMVKEDSAGSSGDRAIEIDIGKHYIRRLATQLERNLLQISRCRLQDKLANFGRPGECNLVHAGMSRQRCSCSLAVSRDDVDYAI